MKLDHEQLKALADLLLGLAHADGEFDFLEADVINDNLSALVDPKIPLDVSRHMTEFDSEKFSITEACGRLKLNDPAECQNVLGVLMKVADADGVHDVREHAFINATANVLGAPLEEVDVDSLEMIEVVPPPLPPSS